MIPQEIKLNTATTITSHHWSILGAGSIGGLWASHLAKAGVKTTLLLQDNQKLDQYQSTPLSLEKEGDIFQPSLQAIAAKQMDRKLEWLLITTKSFSALSALESVAAHLTLDTKVIILTNGLGVHQEIIQRFPRHKIIAGTTTDGVYQRSRFQLVHAGVGETYFGPLANCDDAVMSALQAQLEALDLRAFTCSNILSRLWHKVAVNCCINGLTVIYNCRNGELLEKREALERIVVLAAEVEQVMQAEQIAIDTPLVDAVKHVLTLTADNYSSMYQDIANQRKTEIDHINGYICNRAQKWDISVTENDRLYSEIKIREHNV